MAEYIKSLSKPTPISLEEYLKPRRGAAHLSVADVDPVPPPVLSGPEQYLNPDGTINMATLDPSLLPERRTDKVE